MKFLLTSTQGEGHVRPLIPYARALLASGHEVAVAAPADCSEIIGKSELEHHRIAGITKEQMTAIWSPHWAKNVTRDAMLQIALPQMFVGAMARGAMQGLLDVIERWQPDVIVRESMEFSSLVVAEALTIPHVRVNVHNTDVEARAIGYAIPSIDGLRAEAGLAADEGASLLAEPAFSSFPASFDGDVQREPVPATPFRVWSNSLGPPPETDWVPKGDRPLVYVTFGTMVGVRPGRDSIFGVALDAVAQLDAEILMTVGPDFDISSLGAPPANTTLRGFVPQTSIFPHATAMVCHGGSGTLLGGLAAGLPQVVAPHSADQPFNADKMEEGGFGIGVDASSSGDMHQAILRVMEEPSFAAATQKLAEEMRALPDHEVAAERLADAGGRATTRRE